MRKIMLLAAVVALLGTACLWVPAQQTAYEGVEVPALPGVVVLEAEPFYSFGGFYYHYDNYNWTWSHTRSGPWRALPRDRWPGEVHIKSRGWGDHGRGEHDRGEGERR